LSLHEEPKDKYKLTIVSSAFAKTSQDEALNTISKAIGNELSDLGDVEVITSDYKWTKPIMPKNYERFSAKFGGKRSYSTARRSQINSIRHFSSEPARLWAKLEATCKAHEFFKEN
jgi:hypothetical protein